MSPGWATAGACCRAVHGHSGLAPSMGVRDAALRRWRTRRQVRSGHRCPRRRRSPGPACQGLRRSAACRIRRAAASGLSHSSKGVASRGRSGGVCRRSSAAHALTDVRRPTPGARRPTLRDVRSSVASCSGRERAQHTYSGMRPRRPERTAGKPVCWGAEVRDGGLPWAGRAQEPGRTPAGRAGDDRRTCAASVAHVSPVFVVLARAGESRRGQSGKWTKRHLSCAPCLSPQPYAPVPRSWCPRSRAEPPPRWTRPVPPATTPSASWRLPVRTSCTSSAPPNSRGAARTPKGRAGRSPGSVSRWR